MVLGKLPVPGFLTSLENSRARAYRACSRCGWRLFDFCSLIYQFSSFSLFLVDGPIWTEILPDPNQLARPTSFG